MPPIIFKPNLTFFKVESITRHFKLFSTTMNYFFDGYESLICACSTDLSPYCVMLEAGALNHPAVSANQNSF